MRPGGLATLAGVVPAILGAISLALADGAAPATLPLADNPLSIFSCFIMAAGFVQALYSLCLRDVWRTQHIGWTMMSLLPVALFCLMPLMCMALYGKVLYLGWIALAAYVAAHVHWCKKFVNVYREIRNKPAHWAALYEEDCAACYFIQRADILLLEKKYKIKHFPSGTLFIASIVIAFALVPAMRTVTSLVGLPFAHIFLAIVGFPISLMVTELCVKGWLVYFHYPAQIRQATGKRTYLDMSARPNL